MRPSAKRHPLAVLRLTLGLQKEMADLVGCATITLQSIESGKRPLKENLAEHIAAVTGVDLYWLLEGDPNEPIVSDDLTPYTRRHFEERKEILLTKNPSKRRLEMEFAFIPEVLAMFLLNAYSIMRHGHAKKRLAWAMYKLQVAVERVARELGTDDDIDAKIDQLILDHPNGGKFDAAVHLVKRSQQPP
jgi:transcriptional regulator with XRE-family HTH domain